MVPDEKPRSVHDMSGSIHKMPATVTIGFKCGEEVSYAEVDSAYLTDDKIPVNRCEVCEGKHDIPVRGPYEVTPNPPKKRLPRKVIAPPPAATAAAV